jgi:hypothetical protein
MMKIQIMSISILTANMSHFTCFFIIIDGAILYYQ